MSKITEELYLKELLTLFYKNKSSEDCPKKNRQLSLVNICHFLVFNRNHYLCFLQSHINIIFRDFCIVQRSFESHQYQL